MPSHSRILILMIEEHAEYCLAELSSYIFLVLPCPGEERRQTLYLLFLPMLTALIADCQAWTWEAWQHDTPLGGQTGHARCLDVFVRILVEVMR